jgi:bacillithiol system protein YtxJ
MFRWFQRKGEKGQHEGIPEIDRHTSLDTLFDQDLLVVFKHSPACPVSWAAHRQITRFQALHPLVPVYLVSVIAERAASQQIAKRVQVRHESPQVILLRRGVVVSVLSHGEITAHQLSDMLSAG